VRNASNGVVLSEHMDGPSPIKIDALIADAAAA
jgi:hypothetical protein